MESKGINPLSSDIKNVFISEFPEFRHAFEKLSSEEDFKEMLTEYKICQEEIQKFSDMHSSEELYLHLQQELKEEIFNYIIKHIK